MSPRKRKGTQARAVQGPIEDDFALTPPLKAKTGGRTKRQTRTPSRIQLQCWAILNVNRKELRLLGYQSHARDTHLSSVITGIDAKRRVVKTEGGHTYELVGDPGSNVYTRFTVHMWAIFRGVTELDDVTQQWVPR